MAKNSIDEDVFYVRVRTDDYVFLPSMGCVYWYYNDKNQLQTTTWEGYPEDNVRFNFGNLFRTKTEALKYKPIHYKDPSKSKRFIYPKTNNKENGKS